MLRAIILLFVGILALSSLGCANTAGELTWMHSQGGIVHDARLNRARAECAILSPSADRPVHVQVLDNDSVGAYGWPDGNLFVTRGLVDLLTDKELAAAIAHEMGHLLNDGHLHTVVSLRGCSVSPDIEERADSIGVRLLEEHGIARGAMVSMLEKVRSSPGMSASCQPALDHRIELLSNVYPNR